jgi:hypothetical protein
MIVDDSPPGERGPVRIWSVCKGAWWSRQALCSCPRSPRTQLEAAAADDGLDSLRTPYSAQVPGVMSLNLYLDPIWCPLRC